MKIQGPDFGDIPQAVCLPQQSAQVLSEYPLAWMSNPPKARLLRSVFRTLTMFEAPESSRSCQQISRALRLLQRAPSDTARRCIDPARHLISGTNAEDTYPSFAISLRLRPGT